MTTLTKKQRWLAGEVVDHVGIYELIMYGFMDSICDANTMAPSETGAVIWLGKSLDQKKIFFVAKNS